MNPVSTAKIDTDNAYAEGQLAHKQGFPRSHNPYPAPAGMTAEFMVERYARHEAWNEGWQAGHVPNPLLEFPVDRLLEVRSTTRMSFSIQYGEATYTLKAKLKTDTWDLVGTNLPLEVVGSLKRLSWLGALRKALEIIGAYSNDRDGVTGYGGPAI